MIYPPNGLQHRVQHRSFMRIHLPSDNLDYIKTGAVFQWKSLFRRRGFKCDNTGLTEELFILMIGIPEQFVSHVIQLFPEMIGKLFQLFAHFIQRSVYLVGQLIHRRHLFTQ